MEIKTAERSIVEIIPSEIISQIFTWLDFKDLKNVIFVCRSWKTLVENRAEIKKIKEEEKKLTEAFNHALTIAIEVKSITPETITNYKILKNLYSTHLKDKSQDIQNLYLLIGLNDKRYKTLLSQFIDNNQSIECPVVKAKWGKIHPLQVAARLGHTEIVEYFLTDKRLKASKSFDQYKYTGSKSSSIYHHPVYLAAEFGHLETIKVFEKNDANLGLFNFNSYLFGIRVHSKILTKIINRQKLDTHNTIKSIEDALAYIIESPHFIALIKQHQNIIAYFEQQFKKQNNEMQLVIKFFLIAAFVRYESKDNIKIVKELLSAFLPQKPLLSPDQLLQVTFSIEFHNDINLLVWQALEEQYAKNLPVIVEKVLSSQTKYIRDEVFFYAKRMIELKRHDVFSVILNHYKKGDLYKVYLLTRWLLPAKFNEHLSMRYSASLRIIELRRKLQFRVNLYPNFTLPDDCQANLLIDILTNNYNKLSKLHAIKLITFTAQQMESNKYEDFISILNEFEKHIFLLSLNQLKEFLENLEKFLNELNITDEKIKNAGNVVNIGNDLLEVYEWDNNLLPQQPLIDELELYLEQCIKSSKNQPLSEHYYSFFSFYSAEEKIKFTKKLIRILKGQSTESFNNKEAAMLDDVNLGRIISKHQALLPLAIIEAKQANNPSSSTEAGSYQFPCRYS